MAIKTPQTVVNPTLSLDPAATTVAATFYTAGTGGGIISSICASNTDDTNPVTLNVYLNDTVADFLIGSYTLAANANGVEVLNLTDFAFLTDQEGLLVAQGNIIKIAADSTIAVGKAVKLVGFGGEYGA